MASGSFGWVGLLTSDTEDAKRFYGELFGWESEDAAGGAYSIFRVGGEEVALLYEITDRQRALGASPNWASFVSVTGVELTAARADELGGAVAIPPYDAAGVARIAVIQDPAGARLSLWEPRTHPGPPRTGAVGTCLWNELATPDIELAADFYSDLFGWEIARDEAGQATIANGGRTQGGIRELSVSDEAQRWLPYFRVESVDGGRRAVLRDRAGATFGVCEA